MIAILPLLLAQSQPAAAPVMLSADGSEAMRCAATTGALVSSEEMRIVAATSYYLMMAARSDRGTGPFLPRVQELSPLVTQ